MSCQIQVLGPLVVRVADRDIVRDVTPRGPKIRRLLALLAISAGSMVRRSTIAEELWEERPPRAAAATIRTHVYHLRKALEPVAPRLAAAVVTESTGYRLVVPRTDLDAHRYALAVDRGRAMLARNEPAEAAVVLRAALAMWNGHALADIEPGPVLARHLNQLDELHIAATELRIEADLALGRHRQLVAELRGLVALHPLHEWFHARLIDALHRSGRRADALRAYLDLRRVLDTELGVEPSTEVQLLQRRVLDDAVA